MAAKSSKKHNLTARSSTATKRNKKHRPNTAAQEQRSARRQPLSEKACKESGTVRPAFLELVRDPANSRRIKVWSGPGSLPAVPPNDNGSVLSPELLRFAQVMALPTKPAAFGSTRELFGDISRTLQTYADLEGQSAELIDYFIIATWFPESVQVAPLLVITGSAAGAEPLLRLLRCLCRRAILVPDVTPSVLTGAVMELMPTLILAHSTVNARVSRLVLASGRPGYVHLGQGQPHPIFASKAILLDGDQMREELFHAGVHVSVSPPTRAGRLDETRLQKLEAEFQNKLFGYHLAVRDRVAKSSFDVASFGFEMRPVAQMLGSCIVDDAELQGRVADLLKAQDAENRAAHASDIRCIVVEAVLFHKREGKKRKFLTKEIENTVNFLLRDRGETECLSAKKVGWHLGKLKFRKKREGPGVYIIMDAENQELIEKLAQQYDVLSAQADSAQWMNHVRQGIGSSQ